MSEEKKKEKKEKLWYETSKARYWVAVGYPENMLPDWQDRIDDLVERPYAYCVHDKDKFEITGEEEDRKVHVHIILAWDGPTTYKNALAVFRRLNKKKKNAIPWCEPVANIGRKYAYLIHDTVKARELRKYQYDKSERITGNNFDIGNYIQISEADIKMMRRELADCIVDNNIMDYRTFYQMVREMPVEYEEVLTRYSAHFERILKGNYLKAERSRVSRLDTTTKET